jgi:murein DD-endopeptidase MepM/ murein hydrolase activator NlpD
VDDQLKDLEKQIHDAEKQIEDVLKDKEGRVHKPLPWLLIKIIVSVLLLLVVLPPYYRPVNGSRSSSYFFRMRPESNLVTDIEFHKGVDFAAPAGTSVRPAGFGLVEEIGWSDSFGYFVVVRHLLGMRTLYAHLSSISVAEGRLVAPGVSEIGLVGATGRATGPHLHLEFKLGNASLPPGLFLFFHNLRRAMINF